MNFASKAQNYVTIPDANFVAYLQWLYPDCMNGNLMDTTSTVLDTLTSLSVDNYSITDLTGIQYFTSLLDLSCSGNLLTSLPALPNSLQNISCDQNQLTSLPALPTSLIRLWCNNNQLTNLPVLPSPLQDLDCSDNQLTSIPTLPNNLKYLVCANNNLTGLPFLPSLLKGINSICLLYTSPSPRD